VRPPRAPTLRRRLKLAATERLGYKAVALFLAIALWLFTHFNGRPLAP
jgi:hypothetical protein